MSHTDGSSNQLPNDGVAALRAVFDVVRTGDAEKLIAISDEASLEAYIQRLRPRAKLFTVDGIREALVPPDHGKDGVELEEFVQTEYDQRMQSLPLELRYWEVKEVSQLDSLSDAQILEKLVYRETASWRDSIRFWRVVGALEDSPDQVLVVYQATDPAAGAEELGPPRITSFRRTPDGLRWMVPIDGFQPMWMTPNAVVYEVRSVDVSADLSNREHS